MILSRLIPKKTKRAHIIAIAAIVVLGAAGVGFFLYQKSISPTVRIPAAISQKLLFTPYVPQNMPLGYVVQANSFTVEENALIFSAANNTGQQIAISEQSVPKNFDMDGFYQGNITAPARLSNAKNTAIYGQLVGQNKNILNVTTSDNTWIIFVVPRSISKNDALGISESLVRQN